MNSQSRDERLSWCYHEAGHAAIAWGFGYDLLDYDIVLKEGEAKFLFPTPLLEYLSKEELKFNITRLLAGPLAEDYLAGRQRPVLRVSFRDIDNDAEESDSSRMKTMLVCLGCSLNTEADCVMSMQNQAWNIISEPQTWAAIQKIANTLFERGVGGRVTGRELQKIFKYYGPTRTTEML